ncbi:MAG: bifunctional adenosylcobinamide kinase/adenosylcobinamide-phosphate guanylyltransferase [Nitrospirota bacterium]|nr:bifunctional adenosylcobinamide kinase/adenosylcobinamide-phosphate guanylyltransferase [Nitrospirota bacterium]
MAGQLILVLGGTRSGKSIYALRRAEAMGDHRLYIATAEARDDEMMARIEQHRKQRGEGWRAAEEPLDVAGVLEVTEEGTVVLLDCLTFWVANAMAMEVNSGIDSKAFLQGQIRNVHTATQDRGFRILIVSNEVGMGIVPDNALARKFRDLVGDMHQMIAELADEVYLVVAGLPQKLK